MRRTIAALAGIVALGTAAAFVASRERPKATDQRPVARPLTVREPAVAGPSGFGFYPANRETLEKAVRGHLGRAQAADLPGRLVALIAPHAGYEYCGDVMAHAYKCLKGQSFDTVVIVGPSHGEYFRGAALTDADAWRTPLGMVPIDTALCTKLARASRAFSPSGRAHEREHSLEVQVPFLQVVLGDFKLLPIVVWDRSADACAAIAETLACALAGQNVLLIASTDMSHYPVYDEANAVDKATLEAIKSFDVAKVFAADRELMGRGVANLGCTLCGFAPVVIVMDAARRLGANTVTVLKYANSGDADPAMRSQCVGYCAVAISERKLTSAQQGELLRVARRTLEAALARGQRPAADRQDPALTEPRAVFVTLKKQGLLRGCIGCFEPDAPLIEQVQNMAIKAATRDPRFPPVRAEELKDIEITIEVLSPIRPVASPSEIRVGEHGVIVVQGLRRGVYLPKVATEQGWTREQMLTSLCRKKAGISPNAWRDGAKLYVFTTQSFSEQDLGHSQRTAG